MWKYNHVTRLNFKKQKNIMKTIQTLLAVWVIAIISNFDSQENISNQNVSSKPVSIETEKKTELIDLGDYFKKDDKYVYYGHEIIEWADPETFKKLDGFYAEDKNSVYYMDKIVDWVDINTFEGLDYHYAKDKNNIYHWANKVLEDIDVDSLNVINYDYVEDKDNCYKNDKITDKKECEEAKCFYKDICPEKDELLQNKEIMEFLPKDANIIDVQKIDFENDWKDEYVIEFKSDILVMEWPLWYYDDEIFEWYYVFVIDENGKRNKIYEKVYDWDTVSLDCKKIIVSNKNFLECSKQISWSWRYILIDLFTIDKWVNKIFSLDSSEIRNIIKEWLSNYLLDWEDLYQVASNWTALDSHIFNICDWKGLRGVNITYDLTYEDWKLWVTNVKRNNYYDWGCFWWYEVKWVDEETFKVLSKHYAQDKDNCYKNNKIVDKSECSENIVD